MPRLPFSVPRLGLYASIAYLPFLVLSLTAGRDLSTPSFVASLAVVAFVAVAVACFEFSYVWVSVAGFDAAIWGTIAVKLLTIAHPVSAVGRPQEPSVFGVSTSHTHQAVILAVLSAAVFLLAGYRWYCDRALPREETDGDLNGCDEVAVCECECEREEDLVPRPVWLLSIFGRPLITIERLR